MKSPLMSLIISFSAISANAQQRLVECSGHKYNLTIFLEADAYINVTDHVHANPLVTMNMAERVLRDSQASRVFRKKSESGDKVEVEIKKIKNGHLNLSEIYLKINGLNHALDCVPVQL